MTDTDPPAKPEPPVLKGDEAVALWQQGRDAWNAWIDANPKATIDFRRVDFTPLRDSLGRLTFDGHRFGCGGVYFSDARFGDGDVSFIQTDFSKGNVSFSETCFGKGEVSFDNASFGDQGAHFSYADFGEGDVSFSRVHFGDGNVYIEEAKFGDGEVCFNGARFGIGRVSFQGTNFGNGDVLFDGVDFGRGDLSFWGAHFGNGKLSIDGSTFELGSIFLCKARLNELLFNPKSVALIELRFDAMTVLGASNIRVPDGTKTLMAISLRNALFDGPLTLIGDVAAPPDLRGVKAAHHVELSGLKVTLRRDWPGLTWPPLLSKVAANPEDAARLCRLKEIAEQNRDHRAALRFSADENRARRWRETGWFASVLDMAFSGFSDYGQSVWRPAAALAALTALGAALYRAFAEPGPAALGAVWDHAVRLSLANGLPFLPQTRTLRLKATEALFTDAPNLWLDAAMVAQGLATFVLLFLIGLGLRNRFRL